MNTFEINIQRKSANHWPIVVEHSRPGELLSSRSEGILELTSTDFQQLTSLLGQPKDYGTFLGKAIFKEEIRDAFVSALRDSDATVRVLLFIEAEDKEIRTLRWERLCANIDDGWHLLSLEQRTPYSLYIPAITDRRFPPIGRRDLRALILVASPQEIERYKLDSFDVEAAVSGVRQALGKIPCDVLATVDGAIGKPTIDELCKHLSDRTKQYTMLHFVSHSRVIQDSGETVLYWATAENKVDPVTGTRLIERLRSLSATKGLPHFSFLSTCESASPEAEAALGGLGQRLVRDLGMPAVIAMTEKVTVKTALALGAKFYEQLGKSGEVDLALQEAAASLAERQDITVPALFSRLGGRPLFNDQLDRKLTNSEIKYGLEQLQVLFQERSPILLPKLEVRVEKLTNLLNIDLAALSKEARQEREQALEYVNNLSVAVLDISFNAVALGQEPPIYDARCPFLGLYPFRVENQKFFFGREKLVTQLQQKLEKENFLAVFGASGSGKSSLILAGLIPVLKEKQPDLQMAYMTPNSNPIEQMQASFLEVQNQAVILVIDQFEELFTLCTDNQRRQEFIDKLLFIIQQQKVVITMRADFWGECASYPQLKQLMQSRQELIGPMDTSELRKAMEMQASQVGLRFEADLSNQILDDVQGEPGAMPLLQHALLELWKRRHGRWLRTMEYEAIGGVKMAIAQTADAVYDQCEPPQKEQIKNIFIRLTRLDDSAPTGEKRRDTRRRVWLEELIPSVNDEVLIQQLIKKLAGEGARLVVTSLDSATQREEVEVAHEALIRYWPRLLNWLDENRSLLLLREKIRQEALEWENNQKEESYLVHRGERLKNAQELLKSNFLNVLEATYVQSCIVLRDRQQQEQAARHRREIQIKWTIFTGAVVILLTTSLGIIAVKKGYEAELSKSDSLRQSSLSLSKSAKDLEALTNVIKSAKIIQDTKIWSNISSLIIKNQDQINSQAQVIAVLQRAIDGVKARNYLTGHSSTPTTVVFSPNGKMIATVSKDKTLKLWDLQGQELTKSRLKYYVGVTQVAFSPDSQTLATVIHNKTVQLWDLQANHQLGTLLKHDTAVTSLEFSPDGNTLATASLDRSVILWHLQGYELPTSFLKEDNAITSLVFSADGKTITTATKNNTVKIWDLQGKELAKTSLADNPKETSLVFSPDGKTIAMVTKDNTIKLWDLQDKELAKTLVANQLTTQESQIQDNIFTIRNINPNQQPKPLFKHKSGITTLAFSADGQTIATGSEDNTVILWDLNGNQLQTFKGHEGDITSLAFSPDGNILVSASKDNNIILWNLGGRILQTWTGHQAGVTSLAFSPDGKNIASASKDNTVKLWDLGGKLLRTFNEHKYAVTSVAFSADGNTIASASEDNTVKLWDLTANSPSNVTIPGAQAGFTSVVFSPHNLPQTTNCQFLAAATKDNLIQLWDLRENKPHIWDLGQKQPQILRGHKYAVTSLAFSPDCQTLASASVDKSIMLWSLNGKQLQTFKGHEAAITSIAFSPDSKQLASGSDDKTIILWDLKGNQLHKFQGHEAGITSVAFSPDSDNIASASLDRNIIIWDLNGKKLQTLRGHQAAVTSVAFSSDGKTLASASEDNTIKLWNLKGKHLLQGHRDTVYAVKFSPDGKTLASAGEDNTIKLWNLKGKELATLKNSEAEIIDIVFSYDGKNLAAVSEDNTIKLWDLKSNELSIFKRHPAEITTIFFIKNNKMLVSGSKDKTIKLWNLQGKELATFKGHQAEITTIVLSPNGKMLVSGSKDKTIKLWNLQGKELATFKGHQAEIKDIVFSHDSQNLVSMGADGAIILWDLKGKQLHTFKGNENQLAKIVLSPNSKIIAFVSADQTITLWDFQGNLKRTLIGHEAGIKSMAFSPDGYTLASGSADNNVILW
ncbi:WD-40 repeat-containing protein [Microchaete diplosiphon NIES-3275]|nr:WD-40 repeat-containing protein [Microchaete diplosiphon NIES-3275]